jgi:hypothetical protein
MGEDTAMYKRGLLLIVVACMALGVTNPGEGPHKQAVYSKMPKEAGMEGFLGRVAGDLLGNLDVVPLKYNNYILFSTMTFRGDIVSVGLLSNVWTTDWSSKRGEPGATR